MAVPGVIFAATLVGSAGLVLPGPQWAYLLGAAGILLLGFFFVRGMAQATLEFLGHLSPAVEWVLARRQRRAEYGAVLRGVQRTLEHYRQPGLPEDQLSQLAAHPPTATQDDIGEGCRTFARWLDGREEPRALVLELLYRDRYDLGTGALWADAEAAHHRELARVLTKSGGTNLVVAPARLEEILLWVLGRMPSFRLAEVQEEVTAVATLWRHVESYADHLREAGLTPEQLPPKSENRLHLVFGWLEPRLHEGLLSQAEGHDQAEAVLTQAAESWIDAWFEQQSELPPQEVSDLARIHLGIFAAEAAPSGFPPLPGLGFELAQREPALKLLFAYLWKRSQLQEEALTSPRLEVLASR